MKPSKQIAIAKAMADEAKADFDAAHAQGMADLRSGEFGKFEGAIKAETQAVEQFAAAVDLQGEVIAEHLETHYPKRSAEE